MPLASRLLPLPLVLGPLAHPIRGPGLKVGAALLLVRAREPNEVDAVVRALA
jgi:hypothetical protein